MRLQGSAITMVGLLAISLLALTEPARGSDPSDLGARTGSGIQGDSPLPSQTRRGRCNPADTRCQLPRHRVQPKDSDLNVRTESGRRLEAESSLNSQKRTGQMIDNPVVK